MPLPQPRSLRQQTHSTSAGSSTTASTNNAWQPPQPRSMQRNNQQVKGQPGGPQQQQGPNGGGRATLLLIQPTDDVQSRTYTDHESVADAMRSLLLVYESRQVARGSGSYSTDQLLSWIDSLRDITLLTYDRKLSAFVPFDRKFIKERLYMQLSKQVRR